MSERDRDSRDRRYHDRNSRDRNRNGARGRDRARSRSRERSRSHDGARMTGKDNRRDSRDRRSGERRNHNRGDSRNRRSPSRSKSPPSRRFPNKDQFGRSTDREESRSQLQPQLQNQVMPSHQSAAPAPLLKASIDQVRRERMALVKSITGENDEKAKKKKTKAPEGSGDGNADEEEEGEDDEDDEMAELLGFSGFNSTKGKPVAENQLGAAAGAVSKHKARKYRQYMNRKGGFNRPLDKMD